MGESTGESTGGKGDGVLYVQKGPATMTEMSSHDLARAREQTDVVLLPFGALEAHGDHLPLGTDSMEARAGDVDCVEP